MFKWYDIIIYYFSKLLKLLEVERHIRHATLDLSIEFTNFKLFGLTKLGQVNIVITLYVSDFLNNQICECFISNHFKTFQIKNIPAFMYHRIQNVGSFFK